LQSLRDGKASCLYGYKRHCYAVLQYHPDNFRVCVALALLILVVNEVIPGSIIQS
jgi:hypothetical protein